MTFGNWLVLFLLFLPASILVWVWLYRGNVVAMPWDHGPTRKGRGWQFLINVMRSLPALLLAIAIILLAGPRGYGVPKEKRRLTNIEFCLDLSGSMTAKFGEGSRYDAAMEAINQFIAYRDNDAFGLTIFSDISNQWIPLTTDRSAFRCAIPFLNPNLQLPGFGGGTMIGLGLRECLAVLDQHDTGDRMIILVSDGQSADLDGGQDEIIGHELQDSNIVMYGIHIGDGNVPPEVAAIATITGGDTFPVGDEQGLANVFRQIDAMQVAELERSYAELLDDFWPIVIGGASLLSLLVLSLFGLRFTPW